MTYIEPELKTDSGWHYHAPDFLSRFEGSLVRKMVEHVNDFTEGQIFFLSTKRDDWIPSHVKGYQQGYLQLVTFKYEKLLEVPDFLEYHSLFDYNSKEGYTLSKKGRKIIEEGGYDYVRMTDDELDEGFLVNPATQVTDILSVSLRAKKNANPPRLPEIDLQGKGIESIFNFYN